MNITAYGVTVTVRDERELLAALAYLEAVRQLRLPLVQVLITHEGVGA